MVDNKQNVIKEAEEVVVINEDSTLKAVSQSIESNTELAKDSLNRIQTLVQENRNQVLTEREKVLNAEREVLRVKDQMRELEQEQSKVTITHNGHYGLQIDTTDDLDDVKEEIRKGYAKKLALLNDKVADLQNEINEVRSEKDTLIKSHRSEIQDLKSEQRDRLRAADVAKEIAEQQHKRILDTIAEEQRREIENLRMATRQERHQHNMNMKQLLLDFNHKVSSIRFNWAARLLGLHKLVKDWKYNLESKQWRYLASI